MQNKLHYIELIPPEKQREWGWPAVANFTFGGVGAGFHCLGLLAVFTTSATLPDWCLFFLKLLGPTLAALGFMFLPIEAGRPSRSIFLVHHFRQSWLSRELIFYLFFLLTALLDCFFPSFLWTSLSIVGAVGLILSQGFIVYDAKAMTAWHSPAMPWYFLSSAMASGAGLVMLFFQITQIPLSGAFVVVVMGAIMANAAMWLVFLFRSPRDGAGLHTAFAALKRRSSITAIIGVGHGLPLCLILLSVIKQTISQSEPSLLVITAAGLIMIGVFLQKAGILRQAGNKRSIGFNL